MRRLAVTLLAAGALAVVTAGGAVGKGTLEISPAPVVLGSTFELSGCGYPVPTALSFEVSGPRKSGIHYFTAGEPLGEGSGGCFSDTWTAWWNEAGAYQITSYYRDSRGSTHKVAVAKFAVAAA